MGTSWEHLEIIRKMGDNQDPNMVQILFSIVGLAFHSARQSGSLGTCELVLGFCFTCICCLLLMPQKHANAFGLSWLVKAMQLEDLLGMIR